MNGVQFILPSPWRLRHVSCTCFFPLHWTGSIDRNTAAILDVWEMVDSNHSQLDVREKYTLSSLSHCVWRFFGYSSLNCTLRNAVMMIVFYILLASNCQYWWGTPSSSVRFASNFPFSRCIVFFFWVEGIKVILVSWNELAVIIFFSICREVWVMLYCLFIEYFVIFVKSSVSSLGWCRRRGW